MEKMADMPGTGIIACAFLTARICGRTTEQAEYETETAVVDLSHCELIVFIACSTASNLEGKSITDAAVDAGAAAAIGFTKGIGCVGVNEWMRHFLWYYQYDAGLSRSASKAAAEVSDESLESYRIVLRPQ